MPSNECIPTYRPGDIITGYCSAAVIGKRFVRISGNRTSGPGLSTTAEGGLVQIAPATAGARKFGVALYDAPINGQCPVIRQQGAVVPVLAGAAIAAFEEVEVGTAGVAIPKASGVAVGFAITAAANATDAEISLY